MKDKMQKPITDIEQQIEKERIHALLALSADKPDKADVCPDAEMLAALAENTLEGKVREGLLAHLVVCPDCYEIWLSTANSAQVEKKKGKIIQGPWYTKVTHYIREQKIATTAFAATACLLLFFGARLTMSPLSTVVSDAPLKTKVIARNQSLPPSPTTTHEVSNESATHIEGIHKLSASGIVFQTTDKDSAHAFISGYEREAVTVNVITEGIPTRGAVPVAREQKMKKSAPNLANNLGIWLKTVNRNCLAGKKTTHISKEQLAVFLRFQKYSVGKENKWDQSVSDFLRRMQPLVTSNNVTIDCSQLLPIVDDFLQTTRKQLP